MVKKSRKSVWRCINSGKEKGGFCKAKPVEGHKMEEYVSAAWAQLVSQRENLLSGWEKILLREMPWSAYAQHR